MKEQPLKLNIRSEMLMLVDKFPCRIGRKQLTKIDIISEKEVNL